MAAMCRGGEAVGVGFVDVETFVDRVTNTVLGSPPDSRLVQRGCEPCEDSFGLALRFGMVLAALLFLLLASSAIFFAAPVG